MKYKILLHSKNSALTKDFFIHVGYSYECMTTSDVKEDFLCHLKYFKPHVYIHFIGDSPKEEAFKLFNLRSEEYFIKTPVIIIGNSEDCTAFASILSVDLIIKKPIPAKKIEDMLSNFLEKNITLPKEEDAKIIDSIGSVDSVYAPVQSLQKSGGFFDKYKEEYAKKHILIIDDDKGVLKMLKQYLSDSYEITTVTSGRLGRKFLEKNSTDLILLDYEMPEESGFNVYKGFLSNNKTKDIPVIFLTGVNDKDKIKDVLELKPKGYILKPISIDKLKSAIGKVF